MMFCCFPVRPVLSAKLTAPPALAEPTDSSSSDQVEFKFLSKDPNGSSCGRHLNDEWTHEFDCDSPNQELMSNVTGTPSDVVSAEGEPEGEPRESSYDGFDTDEEWAANPYQPQVEAQLKNADFQGEGVAHAGGMGMQTSILQDDSHQLNVIFWCESTFGQVVSSNHPPSLHNTWAKEAASSGGSAADSHDGHPQMALKHRTPYPDPALISGKQVRILRLNGIDVGKAALPQARSSEMDGADSRHGGQFADETGSCKTTNKSHDDNSGCNHGSIAPSTVKQSELRGKKKSNNREASMWECGGNHVGERRGMLVSSELTARTATGPRASRSQVPAVPSEVHPSFGSKVPCRGMEGQFKKVPSQAHSSRMIAHIVCCPHPGCARLQKGPWGHFIGGQRMVANSIDELADLTRADLTKCDEGRRLNESIGWSYENPRS